MDTPDLPKHTPQALALLRASIARHGVLVPILETTDGVIIDGRIRNAIATDLGLWAPRVKRASLDSPDDAQRLRLELHTAQRQLTRAQVNALIEYHLEATPDLSDRAIASKLGINHETVGKKRTGDNRQLPRKGKDGKIRLMPTVLCGTRAQAKDVDKRLDSIADQLRGGSSTHREVRRRFGEKERALKVAAASKIAVSLPDRFKIFTSDFRNQKEIRSNSVDLMICDPPWNEKQFPATAFAQTVYDLLKPGGLMIAYSGVFHQSWWHRLYTDAGLDYLWTVATIKKKTISRQSNTSNEWCPLQVFWKAKKGKWKPYRMMPDLIDTGPLPTFKYKEYHEWQQSVGELVPLIRSLSAPGNLIADLTLCSGTSALATFASGESRRFIGCEIDKVKVKLARSRLSKALELSIGNKIA